MGVQGIHSIVDMSKLRREVGLQGEQYRERVVAVDVSILLCASEAQFVKNELREQKREPSEQKRKLREQKHELNARKQILATIKLLLTNQIFPIFVFDGPNPSKRSTRRLAQRDLPCKEMLAELGIPYATASREAEALCCELVLQKLAFAVLSTDTDVLLFGCPRMVSLSRNRTQFIETRLADVLESLGLKHAEFVDLCILLGTDFSTRQRGVGPKKALALIKAHGSIENLHFTQRIKDSYIECRANFSASAVCCADQIVGSHSARAEPPAAPQAVILANQFSARVATSHAQCITSLWTNASLLHISYLYAIPRGRDVCVFSMGALLCEDQQFVNETFQLFSYERDHLAAPSVGVESKIRKAILYINQPLTRQSVSSVLRFAGLVVFVSKSMSPSVEKRIRRARNCSAVGGYVCFGF